MLLFYSMSSKESEKLFKKYDNRFEKVFDYFKRKAEDTMPEGEVEHIGVDDVEELNDIAHEVAERRVKRYKKTLEEQEQQEQQEKEEKKEKSKKKKSKKTGSGKKSSSQ